MSVRKHLVYVPPWLMTLSVVSFYPTSGQYIMVVANHIIMSDYHYDIIIATYSNLIVLFCLEFSVMLMVKS